MSGLEIDHSAAKTPSQRTILKAFGEEEPTVTQNASVTGDSSGHPAETSGRGGGRRGRRLRPCAVLEHLRSKASTVYKSEPMCTRADAHYGSSQGSSAANVDVVFENAPMDASPDARADSVFETPVASTVFESTPIPSKADVRYLPSFGAGVQEAEELIQAAVECEGNGGPTVFESTPVRSSADASTSAGGAFTNNRALEALELAQKAAEIHGTSAQGSFTFESKPRASTASNRALEALELAQKAAEMHGTSAQSSFTFESQPRASTASARHGEVLSDRRSSA